MKETIGQDKKEETPEEKMDKLKGQIDKMDRTLEMLETGLKKVTDSRPSFKPSFEMSDETTPPALCHEPTAPPLCQSRMSAASVLNYAAPCIKPSMPARNYPIFPPHHQPCPCVECERVFEDAFHKRRPKKHH